MKNIVSKILLVFLSMFLILGNAQLSYADNNKKDIEQFSPTVIKTEFIKFWEVGRLILIFIVLVVSILIGLKNLVLGLGTLFVLIAMIGLVSKYIN